MINSIIIEGRFTRNVELKKTNSGTSVCEFDLACTRNRKNESGEYESDFFRCKAFTYTAEYAARYGVKGARGIVSGRLQNRSYEAKDGTKRMIAEIIVNDLSIAAEKPNRVETEQAQTEYHTQPANAAGEPQRAEQRPTDTLFFMGDTPVIDSDDLPF